MVIRAGVRVRPGGVEAERVKETPFLLYQSSTG